MVYDVLLMGYKNPDPFKIRELLQDEQSYIKAEYPEKMQNKIFIFSYVILFQTEEINEKTVKKARRGRIEYNLNFKDLNTKADCHGVQRMKIEL